MTTIFACRLAHRPTMTIALLLLISVPLILADQVQPGSAQAAAPGPKKHIGCPTQDGPMVTLLPHETDCDKFYTCSKGLAYEKICMTGLHFNDVVKVCDHPERAGCDKSLQKETKEENITPPDEPGRQGVLDPRCPAVNGASQVFLPDSSDCSKYYLCNNGYAYPFTCPGGLHFSVKMKTCSNPNTAGCQQAQAAAPGPKEHIGCPTQDGSMVTLLPHETDCDKFYTCSKGLAYVKTCHPGLHFNDVVKVCDYPERAGCDKSLIKKGINEKRITTFDGTERPGVPDPRCPSTNGPYPVFFPDSRDCTKYYMCNSGYSYPFTCPAGLYFSVTLSTCTNPATSGCTPGVARAEDIPRTFSTVQGRPGARDFRCPAIDGPTPTFIPDSQDCNKYLMCNSGLAFPFDCPADLHFNPRLRVCDRSAKVPCTNPTVAY